MSLLEYDELLATAQEAAGSALKEQRDPGAAVTAAINAALVRVLMDLHALLYPEQHPPGTPFHDPDHRFWQGRDPGYALDPGEVFEWPADVGEWVGTWVVGLLNELGAEVTT